MLLMNDELAVLIEVTERLESTGIAYMVTGSLAMALYAIPRMTRDIDIIIQVTRADAARIMSAFADEYYIDEGAVREAILRHGMFNLISQRTFVKIDFIVQKDEAYRIEEFARRRKIAIEGHAIWSVAPEDLILSKLLWAADSGSELQLRDAQQLFAAVHDIDITYLRAWAMRLGIARLLEKVIHHA